MNSSALLCPNSFATLFLQVHNVSFSFELMQDGGLERQKPRPEGETHNWTFLDSSTATWLLSFSGDKCLFMVRWPKFKESLCNFGKEIQTQNLNIQILNVVITQIQKYVFFP